MVGRPKTVSQQDLEGSSSGAAPSYFTYHGATLEQILLSIETQMNKMGQMIIKNGAIGTTPHEDPIN